MVVPNLMASLVPRLKWCKKMWSWNETTSSLPCLLANTLLDLPLQLLMSTLLIVVVDGSVMTTSCGKRPVVIQQVSGLLRRKKHHWHYFGWSKLLTKICIIWSLGISRQWRIMQTLELAQTSQPATEVCREMWVWSIASPFWNITVCESYLSRRL